MNDFDMEILEQMATRFNPLPTNNDFLDRRYDWQKRQKNDNGAERPYYRFFYHLTQWLQPNLVLELGTYQGTAAAHFAAYYYDALVITVDHHTDPGDDMNQLKVLEVQDNFPNVIYYQGWTTPYLAEENKGKHFLGDAGSAFENVIATVEHYQQKLDILFIDSWHCYEYAKQDWEAYQPFLNSPALLICDDIQADEEPKSSIQGMMKFWDELPKPKFLNDKLHPGTHMGFVKV